MIGRSPVRNSPDFTFYPKADGPRRLEKSYTRTQGIQRTPSIQNINPYLEHIDAKSTDKKKSGHNVAYQAPVLIQQNKTLLAENREMAMLIHERNLQIQALERKYQEKIEGEEDLFRQIQAQKQRFVGEVIRHKEQTDQQILALQSKIRDLEDEKVDIEKTCNRSRLSELERTEIDMRKELEKINIKYQDNLDLLQTEKMRLKSQLEHKSNELQVLEMENKQKAEELRYETQKAKEEATHSDHLRKLESAQMKHYYESKIQKLHLDHRRQKELFLVEHDAQIKKFEEDIEKIKRQQMVKESQMKQKEQEANNMMLQQINQKERFVRQVDSEKEMTRQRIIRDKQAMASVFEAQNQVLQINSTEEINALLQQNKHITDLLQVKTEEIKRLYSEIDALRDRYCAQLQQNQKIISELFSKMYVSEIGNEEEKQLLKTKLAVLRETDLKGLRGYYENQLKVVNEALQEKDNIILSNRSKFQEELRKKDELRKRYQMESSKQKHQIMDLNTKIKDLEAQMSAGDKQNSVKIVKLENNDSRELKSKEKVDCIRQQELLNLQQIIKAKDTEIEQLQKKILQLKSNQLIELEQRDIQITQQKGDHNAVLQEKQKEAHHLKGEIQKLKDLLQKEKEGFDELAKNMNDRRKDQLEHAGEELANAKIQYDLQIVSLKNQVRNLTFEVSKLHKQLKSSEKERELIKSDIQNTHVVNSNREKEMLEEFYQSQIRIKDEQILDLRQRNAEIASDIIDARENYASLQKKLQNLIESQSSLREIERKVMHLGKENNLMKNKKEISS